MGRVEGQFGIPLSPSLPRLGRGKTEMDLFKPGKEAMMPTNKDTQGSQTPLARLIEQVSRSNPAAQAAQAAPASSRAAGSALWERLDMERVARRVIQTARIATAEHAMQRVERAVRLRDESKNRPATA